MILSAPHCLCWLFYFQNIITFLFKIFSYAAEILILSDVVDFLTGSLGMPYSIVTAQQACSTELVAPHCCNLCWFFRILLPSNSKQFSYAAVGLEIHVSNCSKCYHVFSFATGMLRQWSAAALPLQILVEQHYEFTSALGIHLLDMNSAIRFQICIDIDHIWITQVQYASLCCRNCCRVLAVDRRVTRTSSS